MNGNNFFTDFCRHIGETVTIYTKTGGQSGCGFTGVILGVSDDFVRLITNIGPAPGCALGSDCNCGGRGRRSRCRICSIGSNVDIPFDSIAAVVYNAV
ncbi:MAG: hypothetical protein GX257_09735 [Clostridiales bacterium]|jgi:hypothetical protein|nr:hypothetical protein [Clostridiales bacterium]